MRGEKSHPLFAYRIQDDGANEVHHHFRHALQLAGHQLARRSCHHHQYRHDGNDDPHHDNGLIDGNIQSAEGNRNPVMKFKRMQRTFFHGDFALSLLNGVMSSATVAPTGTHS